MGIEQLLQRLIQHNEWVAEYDSQYCFPTEVLEEIERLLACIQTI